MKYRLYRTLLICILTFLTASVYAQEIIIPERWQIKPVIPIYKEDTLTVRIFGDLMMHEAQITDAARPNGTYDFSSYFTHIQKFLDNSDLNIGNMEFSLAGKPYTGYPAVPVNTMLSFWAYSLYILRVLTIPALYLSQM